MTKKNMWFSIIFFGVVGLVLSQPETSVESTKISDNLYYFKITTFYPVNSLASIGPDGILLVDPGMAQSYDGLMEALAKISDQKVTTVINTHSHDHHISMNKRLGKTAKIYSHAASTKLMQSGLDVLVEWPAESFPACSIDKDTSIFFNGEEILLVPVPGGHCGDDMMVYFTKSKVACTGGVLKAGAYPMIDYARGGDFRAFPDLAKHALNYFSEDVKFIQSHGRMFSYEEAQDYVLRLETSIPLIKTSFSAEKDLTKMLASNPLKDLLPGKPDFPNQEYWIRTLYTGLALKNNGVKKSLTEPLYHALQNGSAKEMVRVYEKIKKTDPDSYGIDETVLNLLGYYLIGKNRLDDAIVVLKLNAKEYPKSFNVYDSLGEAYMYNGNLWRAKRNYKKSLRLYPMNENGKAMLEKIRTGA